MKWVKKTGKIWKETRTNRKKNVRIFSSVFHFILRSFLLNFSTCAQLYRVTCAYFDRSPPPLVIATTRLCFPPWLLSEKLFRSVASSPSLIPVIYLNLPIFFRSIIALIVLPFRVPIKLYTNCKLIQSRTGNKRLPRSNRIRDKINYIYAFVFIDVVSIIFFFGLLYLCVQM